MADILRAFDLPILGWICIRKFTFASANFVWDESAQNVTSAAGLLDQNSRVRYRLYDTLPVTRLLLTAGLILSACSAQKANDSDTRLSGLTRIQEFDLRMKCESLRQRFDQAFGANDIYLNEIGYGSGINSCFAGYVQTIVVPSDDNKSKKIYTNYYVYDGLSHRSLFACLGMVKGNRECEQEYQAKMTVLRGF
jgi:hypothetical protein